MRPAGIVLRTTFSFLLAVSTAGAAGIPGFDPHGEGPVYPDCANGRKTEPPSLPAHRIHDGPVEVDGRLTEGDWIAAPAAAGFTQFEPDRRGEPCEETVFKVIYDDEALYFGVACYRFNGSPVTGGLARRDRILESSDLIRVYISPYHDMVTGYHFRVNPRGVKEDYYNYGDLFHDGSWDAVWDAATSVDAQGWYAELRIPFSSIRYRGAPSMTWGCNVFQHILSRGERTAWSNWDRDQNGFMSRSGTITGIEGIRAPRQIEITPYAVGTVIDPADPSAHGPGDEDWRRIGNAGADVKYGVTADLTLNATIQPDFGQVEADPSQLNLSPFETYYEEKRPFFIEGAQFFWHPDFTVFYSRRIGTGSENARIRFAGKLTGKMAGNVSTAVLVAATDQTENGKAHNLLKAGRQRGLYAIARLGKQFHGEMHSFHVMQTAVVRDEETFDRPTRNGYTTGADFELNFKDRMYQATGSFVGSIIDELPPARAGDADPRPTYGTGSRFEFEKTTGDWRFAVTTRHQGDKLDLNDLGYITDPNHYAGQVWVTRQFNADDEGRSAISSGTVHLRYYHSWIYQGRRVADPLDPSRTIWSYKRGHRLLEELHFEGSLTTRNYWGVWCGAEYDPPHTDLYATRRMPTGEPGPLMARPAQVHGWAGLQTDTRKDRQCSIELRGTRSEEGNSAVGGSISGSLVQEGRINHSLSFTISVERADAQWLENRENPSGGIGGVSYIFGKLDQRTWDLTWRTSALFTRDASLDLYVQPYLTVGSYGDPRELARPDSYDLRPYAGYDASLRDFAYGAVNANLVYRWEYRPGSTFYLVWAHTRGDYDMRAFHGPGDPFRGGFQIDPLVDNEGENRFMTKISYWFPV